MALDANAFVYVVILLVALVKLADWIAPYHNLTEAGCRVSYVYDGDTVALTCGGTEDTARLLGFDAPEAKSPGCPAEARAAARATERLRELVTQGDVTLSGQARDKYGRRLVTLRVDGANVADTLIAEDLAVAYDGGGRIDWCARLNA